MTFKIVVGGTDGVIRELENTSKIPQQVVRDLAQFVFNRARAGAGRHIKTGALESSTYIRKITDGLQVGHDANRAPHAVFVHFGTKPHAISPKNKKILRWASDGRFIFARKVNHPGYEGDPWLFNAVDEANARFDEIATASIKKVGK